MFLSESFSQFKFMVPFSTNNAYISAFPFLDPLVFARINLTFFLLSHALFSPFNFFKAKSIAQNHQKMRLNEKGTLVILHIISPLSHSRTLQYTSSYYHHIKLPNLIKPSFFLLPLLIT